MHWEAPHSIQVATAMSTRMPPDSRLDRGQVRHGLWTCRRGPPRDGPRCWPQEAAENGSGSACLPIARASARPRGAGPVASARGAVEPPRAIGVGAAAGRHADTHGAVRGNPTLHVDHATVVADETVGDRHAVAVGAVALTPGGYDQDAPCAVIWSTGG